MAGQEHQLGDFIKGRFLFVEEYCRSNGKDPQEALEAIRQECLRTAGTPERREFLERKLFGGAVLSSSLLPDWVDKLFLEAVTHALRGPGAPLHTSTSKAPCIPFEAGRFNARRQAETVFKALYSGKAPAEWLKHTFPILYRQCYGPEAGARLKVEEVGPGRFKLEMDNRGLEKASPLDCATTIGYLFGSLEFLRAKEVAVNHTVCGLVGRPGVCVFDITWRA